MKRFTKTLRAIKENIKNQPALSKVSLAVSIIAFVASIVVPVIRG